MYQQADTTNLLGRRRWTSGLQGYVTSEALARRMPVQSARAPAGWTGLGQTTATSTVEVGPVKITVEPSASAAEVSAIDKLKAWLAEETIMAGYANQWFVVGGALAYFLLRKK